MRNSQKTCGIHRKRVEFAFQRGILEKAWNSRKRRGIHRDGVEFTKKRGIGRRVLGDVGRSGHTTGSLPPAATLRAKKGYQLARDFPSSSTILHEHSLLHQHQFGLVDVHGGSKQETVENEIITC